MMSSRFFSCQNDGFLLILFIFANIYIINHLKPDSTMKTTRRSTTLQAIMRTAFLFMVLLSFPATIMAYEETLDNGVDKFKYSMSGNVTDNGSRIWDREGPGSSIVRENIQLSYSGNQINIEASKLDGKSQNYKIEVTVGFWKRKGGMGVGVGSNYKDVATNDRFSKSYSIPDDANHAKVTINYIGKGSSFGIQAEYTLSKSTTATRDDKKDPFPKIEQRPYRTKYGDCHMKDSKIRFNDFYGEVKIRCNFDEDDSFEFVDIGTVIYEDDRIKTEEDSGAILGLEDMSTYVIKPESILIIHTEEDKTSRLELIVGAIVGNWKKMLQGKSIKCEMSQCVAGISGTIVAFEETGKESRVWLLAGSVGVKSKKTGKVTKLKPGQRSVTGTNGVVQVKSFNIEEGARKFGISMDDIKNHYSNSNGNAPTAHTGNTKADNGDNTIYDVTPTMPEFPGGAQAMGDYIAKNLKYPADAKQQGKDGFVMIQFVVEKDGSRSDVKVMRNGKLPSMDKEALRVVNSMPKFSPGRNEKNQPVRVKFVVPVRFKLN